MNNDLDFLEDPSRAEEDGAPAAMYDKPSSDEEGDAAFNFDAPGIVFQSVYTMLLYGQLSFSVTMFQFSFSVQVVFSCMLIFSNHYLLSFAAIFHRFQLDLLRFQGYRYHRYHLYIILYH